MSKLSSSSRTRFVKSLGMSIFWISETVLKCEMNGSSCQERFKTTLTQLSSLTPATTNTIDFKRLEQYFLHCYTLKMSWHYFPMLLGNALVMRWVWVCTWGPQPVRPHLTKFCHYGNLLRVCPLLCKILNILLQLLFEMGKCSLF